MHTVNTCYSQRCHSQHNHPRVRLRTTNNCLSVPLMYPPKQTSKQKQTTKQKTQHTKQNKNTSFVVVFLHRSVHQKTADISLPFSSTRATFRTSSSRSSRGASENSEQRSPFTSTRATLDPKRVRHEVPGAARNKS